MDEFALIRHYFTGGGTMRDDIVLGIGDDGAVLRVPEGQELVVSTDSLVSGLHFPVALDPEAVGYRALAVNLSDLAAMGAEPAWALLALTFPEVDEAWLEKFSRGFFSLAGKHSVALVGGNVARGPLNITITAHGLIPTGQALMRKGARPGDAVCVTGHLGDAAAGLELLQTGQADVDDVCVRRFCFPEPRVAAGIALRGIASAMIDVSDGLLADLSHLLETGGIGATVELARLPLSKRIVEMHAIEAARRLALTGGDDYELCFTVAQERLPEAQMRLVACGCVVTRIGTIHAGSGLRVRDEHGRTSDIDPAGYRHFQ